MFCEPLSLLFEECNAQARAIIVEEVLADLSFERRSELLKDPAHLGVHVEAWCADDMDPCDLEPLLSDEDRERLRELVEEALLARLPKFLEM